MPISSRCKLRFLSCAVTCLLTASCAVAQVVGIENLVHPQLSGTSEDISGSQWKDKQYCVPSGGIADGVEIENVSLKLALTVARAELEVFDGKPVVSVTLRLKNVGDEPASIPWVDRPVQPRQISEEAGQKTFGYEVTTIAFYSAPPHRKRTEFTLGTEVVLWAQPGNESQHIRLRPGEWVDLESRVEVICSQAESSVCLRRLHEVKLRIGARWYQRKLTTTMYNDCIFQKGAYTQNEIDSKPVEVANAPSTSQSDRKD